MSGLNYVTLVKHCWVNSDSQVCTFENGLEACGFSQYPEADDFDWTIHSGPTDSVDTGPSSDADGDGFYLYTEASKPRQPGDIAKLVIILYSFVHNYVELYHIY